MNGGPSQLDELHRASRKWCTCGGAVLALASVWALWPIEGPKVEPVRLIAPPSSTMPTGVGGFDVAAFNAPIWNPTPQPKPPAPLPPLRLQLVAITLETSSDGGQSFRAAVFDPDSNELSQVAAGERIAGRQVLRVTATALEVSDASGPRKLVLDTIPMSPADGAGRSR